MSSLSKITEMITTIESKSIQRIDALINMIDNLQEKKTTEEIQENTIQENTIQENTIQYVADKHPDDTESLFSSDLEEDEKEDDEILKQLLSQYYNAECPVIKMNLLTRIQQHQSTKQSESEAEELEEMMTYHFGSPIIS
jgi:superfamily I DNA/RNA helicase